jgi:competence protein ComEA
MARRDRIDPETARVVEQRLQWLLKENGADPTPGVAARAASSPSSDPPAEGSAGLRSAVAGFRRPHLVIVAAIVTLGILLAGWAVLRARPVAVAVTPPPVSASRTSSAEPSAAAASPSGTVSMVVVHVLGAVRKPGLVSLGAGSRVQDALDAAGGLTRKADPGELNLAQPVTDGQQILVGTRSEPHGEVRDGTGGSGGSGGSGPGGAATGDGSAGEEGQPVNLNTATQGQLEELPGVGPVMAGKIIAWRTENGRFSRIEELQEIDGVGPKTYAKLAPLCRI